MACSSCGPGHFPPWTPCQTSTVVGDMPIATTGCPPIFFAPCGPPILMYPPETGNLSPETGILDRSVCRKIVRSPEKKCKDRTRKCHPKIRTCDCRIRKASKCPKSRPKLCPKLYPYYQVGCGCLSATLSVVATPITFSSAGTVITYVYTITNTGTAPICNPVTLQDSKLGAWYLPHVYIAPNTSQSYTRTYITTSADVANGNIVTTTTAYIQIKSLVWVVTNTIATTVTYIPT